MMHVDPAQFVRSGRSFEIRQDVSRLWIGGPHPVWKLRCVNDKHRHPECVYREEGRAELAGVIWVVLGIAPPQQPEIDTAHPSHRYSPAVARMTAALVELPLSQGSSNVR